MDETTLSFAAIVFAVIVTRAAIRQFRIADQQLIDLCCPMACATKP